MSVNTGIKDPKPLSEEEVQNNMERCNKFIQTGFSRNVTIQFLLNRLVNMGCTPPAGFVSCIDCGDRMAGGGFGVLVEESQSTTTKSQSGVGKRGSSACAPSERDIKNMLDKQKDGKTVRLLPEIYLCHNRYHLIDEGHAHKAMVHELIHAIDLCRTKMDPFNNCVQFACTEIRAENLSGECDWFKEMSYGQMWPKGFSGHNKICVKRRALLSVEANPNCKERAKEAVDAAFNRCYKDTFPFDRHPNLKR